MTTNPHKQDDLTALTPLTGLVSHTTTHHIPTLYASAPATASASASASASGNEITAGLFFRVGQADETLATAGLTHLVEHLALHRLGLSDLHYNGATANTYTLFHVHGSEDEVVTYLNSVCAALRDLPMQRLETEKEILRTEAAGRGGGPQHRMPLWRYGAQGYGLPSYNELGTWSLTPDQVRDWARTRFTRDNAVLWITSDHVPEGLDLTLPEGTRFPAPAATSALPTTPAYISGDDGHVVLTSVLRRSTAAGVFADVLGRALFQDLRQEGGYSYTAEADYSPRDADFATLTAYADALPQKQDAVVGGFVDTLARLRAGRIEQSELDSVRTKLLKRYDTPDLAAATLPSYALSLLLGHRILTPEQHKAELNAVTLDDLREVAREAWDSALLQVPGRGVDWAGLTLAPQFSSTSATVTGTRHQSLEDEQVTLVIGAEGVSLLTPRGPITVRYDACAAMTTRPDGARSLTGHDGFSVTVEPTLYRGVTPERIAALDAAVPSEATVRMPARAPDHIPQPQPRNQTAARQSATGAATTWAWTTALCLVGLLALSWGLLCGIITADESAAAAPEWDAVVGVWILELPLAFATWKLHTARKTRRQR
ncbi:Predicted Zn-dependent peptidase [Streptomyces sp. yr375]|uniref:M16 family metallopeptidase n=1 Tax=Streptomyces sp. yr375 TaxID=1761906 RepID=UPI0008C05F04|nr:insulinase family protein [Streptomyces sp. yr375]SER56807.1 Predicted Zn-dependent peptidase [Streptomyces sp. yr375]